VKSPIEESLEIALRGLEASPETVLEALEEFVTKERRQRIEEVIPHRITQHRIVLEDIFDAGNLFAIYRSAEAFGFQYLDVIHHQNEKMRLPNRTARKAEQWLSIRYFDHPMEYLNHHAHGGLRLAVTHPDAELELADLDFSIPTALVFGNEKDGVSPYLQDRAQVQFKIPMRGFSQSFNVSVAVSICLFHVFGSLGKSAYVNDSDLASLRAFYYLRSHPEALKILERRLHEQIRVVGGPDSSSSK